MPPFLGQALNVSKKRKKKNALFFVPLVPGFSTASYLKVHIKTHHGSPLPTIHTFPEPRGELQMHNGNPFHMGRQCLVEGKRPLVPFRTFMFLAFHLLCCFLERKKKAHAAASLFEMEHISLCCYMFTNTQCHMLVVYLLSVVGVLYPRLTMSAKYGYDNRC